MELLIDSLPQEIVLGATGIAEIAQNVKLIISTIMKTVPLDRAFGIDADLLDLPLPVAQAKLSSEIVQKVEKYEPRVKVISVTFQEDQAQEAMDGKLNPHVKIKIKEITK